MFKLKSKRSGLSVTAATVGRTAAAGYGLSMGHDLWKATKKGKDGLSIILVVLGSLVLPVLGGRELVRGHDRGFAGTLFKTFLGSLFLAAAGFALAWFVFFILIGLLASQPNGLPAPWQAVLWLAASVTAVMWCVGLLWGAIERPARLKSIGIQRANEQFLENRGFRTTDGDDITHFDPDGQPLRFIEAHSDRIVFMAVGKRGKRGFINLDAEGRMTSYSGVM
ncbi:hypothetical protein N181_01890 [Sinorhizobium fredii USDA 205]|uniref:Uncharacterized protein n=1 Tax=Rhizobium fredii TaxID=380 RepID=A0A844AH90_RHIFR|nr:hypothetical protein [Sinorhizobium fredii]KSV87376.1 hypothetical protein N181_01890 [Sinorhizobium fredii USDA 205]MQX11781.1 hypothetical protein [Sinorhizobium fredii]GEC31680.1 hypothetical protein EFR01_18510 [Sinorhizobium fredii]GLS09003.1 hypothetical protein GCM10007864_26330 [Sinorhizobium fredii]